MVLGDPLQTANRGESPVRRLPRRTSTRARTDALESHKRPRQDSNLGTRFRKPMLYPLSYGGE